MTEKKLPGASPGLNTKTILERSWEGLPGYVLTFPVSIALSGSMSTEREQTIGLTKQERADLLLDFRIRLLGDVLTEPPKMLSIEKATNALGVKQDLAYTKELEKIGATNAPTTEDQLSKAERVKNETGLTEEELAECYEYFPGWDNTTPDTLPEKTYNFFSQKDGDGRQTYQLLIEAVIQDYWIWATPRPTISASAFLQSKRLTSITNSGS